jgi:pimeloyl-ACP methyl ester carboxylesterase
LDKISLFKSEDMEQTYKNTYEEALRLWPIPYERIYIETKHGITHIIVCGSSSNPPLILLHPAGCGSIIWRKNVSALSEKFRIYAVDTISEVNMSTLINPINANQDFIDWLTEIIHKLDIKKAYLVGNSFGGYLALKAAIEIPDLLIKVSLISPAASFMQMWGSFWHVFIPSYIIGPIIKSKRFILKGFDWMWQGFPIEKDIATLREITALAGLPPHQPPEVFSNEALANIKIPVLLLIGDHEVIYKAGSVIDRAKRLVPDIKTDIIANANHNAQYTACGEVNKSIIDYFGC